MTALEDSLRARPDDPRSAPLYLRLGRLKHAFEPKLSKGAGGEPYALEHPNEFRYNEVGGDYLYTGYHFRQLLERFPESTVADSAAWELSEVSPGGECEGDVPCEISIAMDPVAEFLRRYPRSPLAAAAVRRINAAFTDALEPYPDLTASTEWFPSQPVQGRLETYQEMIEGLQPAVRARASATIADLWVRFRRYDRARELYAWLLATPQTGADTVSVRRRLLALPRVTFLLHPAQVISDTRVDLSWDRVTGDPVGRYVVFRSSAEPEWGAQLAELATAAMAPGEPLRYSDPTAEPGHDHWYRVVARRATGEIVSNPVHAQPPARLRVRALVFNAAEKHLYVFGYLDNRFPRVLRVSESGQLDKPGDGGLLGLGTGRINDSTQDRYLDEAWFIDPTGQAFLRFHKSAAGFADANRAAIRAGLRFAGDTTTLTFANVLVAVDPVARQMRIEWAQDLEALSCDWQNAVCWEGRGSSIRQVDLLGKTIKDIHLPLAFIRAIHADSRDRSAWAYRSGTGALIHVDSTGAIVRTLPLARPDRRSLPLAFDLAHGWVWAAVQGRLIKRGLDGQELASVPLPPLSVRDERFLAPDTAAGAVWMLAGAGLFKFDRDAKRVFETTLPGAPVVRR